MTSSIQLKKNAAKLSLIVGFGMLAAKLGAYLITGSAAIFSDAAESIVHIMATAMALFSIYLSAKPADESHLYGHGNIEYFSAGIEGALIIIAAVVIINSGVNDIIYGSKLKQLDIGVIIISSAGAINLLLGNYLIKMGKKTNSLTLIADGKHVLTDSYTSIGVIIGILLVIITGFQILDPFFAIGVAINILFTGYKLVRESIGGLMKETNKEVLNKLIKKLASIKKEYWIDLHELRFWQSGERIFVDLHLIFPYYFTIQQTHTEENAIEDELVKEFPSVQLKIHFDYCVAELCKFCEYSKCPVRTAPFSDKFEWDIKKMTGKPIYLIK
jgi:cation diffusion facilitator family transporter